jgi:hypothetical protein
MTWTKAAVEHRLIEAQRVINATVRRPGVRVPSRATDVPPASSYYGLNEVLEFERDRWAHYHQEGHYDPKTGLLIKPILTGSDRIPPALDAIGRAHMAARWPAQYISDERRRVAVVCYVVFKTNRKHGFKAAVNDRLRRLWTAEIGKSQCYRLKDEGVSAIVEGLNLARVPVEWEMAA